MGFLVGCRGSSARPVDFLFPLCFLHFQLKVKIKRSKATDQAANSIGEGGHSTPAGESVRVVKVSNVNDGVSVDRLRHVMTSSKCSFGQVVSVTRSRALNVSCRGCQIHKYHHMSSAAQSKERR